MTSAPFCRRACLAILLGGLALAVPASAIGQLLPPLSGTIDRTLGAARDTLEPVDRTLDDARTLARAQVERGRDLIRRHPGRIALDPDGHAVRAGEVTVIDADPPMIAAAAQRGFRLIEQVMLEELGVGYARFEAPRGMAIGRALRRMRDIAGGREVSADPLHFTSGMLAANAPAAPVVAPAGRRDGQRIGIVDGGVGPGTPGLASQRGFARGGPRAQDHASAIASLLTGGGGVRASAGGGALYVADVYGDDPAGGNATAIARAIAWLVGERVPVVVISLVGPPNPLLARVVAAARGRGTLVVAAVGNDGPAAPPAYPASYPQAIAVTGVDGRGRPLIEAGRARRIDYAAPAADMLALDAAGRARTVRGTSFAAPFVAARISAHLAAGETGGDMARALAAVDREARPGGPRTGRGILCAGCRTPPR